MVKIVKDSNQEEVQFLQAVDENAALDVDEKAVLERMLTVFQQKLQR